MQSYSDDLLALYQAAPTSKIYRATLFKIGPARNGAMLYCTDGKLPVTYDGNTYQPALYGFWTRGKQTIKIGWDSNSIDLTVKADQEFIPMYFPGTNNTVYLLDGIDAGLLDSAPVTIYRATMTTWGQVVGPTGGSLVSTRFVGEVGDISNLGPTKATIKVNDLLYRLNLSCPRMIIQAQCRWVLYSPGCTLNQADFTRTGQIAATSDPRTFTTTAHIAPYTSAGTFAQGILKFTTGGNNGISYFVAAWTPGEDADIIQLDTPPLFTMNPPDQFQVSQGCNHQFSSCLDLQGSTNAPLNFGACSEVPVAETAI